MALVTYNNVSLPYCDVTDFRMESVADPSNTDRILTKFNVGVQTVLTPDFVASFGDFASVPNNVVGCTQLIYNRLMERRKQLSVTFNGVEMIPERQQGVRGYVDAANGPTPKRCDLIPVNGMTDLTFLLLFEIEANYWINQSPDTATPNKNLPGNVVLYNRWNESVTIDEMNRTTKVRSGKLMIRSDNIKGWIADQVRNLMAVTGLPPGRFLRKSSRYKVSEDGLGLEYDIVDQEVWRMPPPPAYKATANYSETGTRADGKRYASCSIRLWGDNDTLQNELIQTAAAVCYAKVNSRGAKLNLKQLNENLKAIVMGNYLDVSAYENVVSYRIDVLLPAFLGVRPSAALWPDYPEQPNYWSRGTASLLLQAAKYYDPSLRDTVLGPGTQADEADNVVINNFNDVQLSRGVQPGQAGINP